MHEIGQKEPTDGNELSSVDQVCRCRSIKMIRPRPITSDQIKPNPTDKNAPPLPSPLLHPMEAREKSRSLMQPSLCRENPPGGGSFVRGRRWLVPYSPLRGCAELAALATGKIPRRRPPANFKAGSERS